MKVIVDDVSRSESLPDKSVKVIVDDVSRSEFLPDKSVKVIVDHVSRSQSVAAADCPEKRHSRHHATETESSQHFTAWFFAIDRQRLLS